MSLVAKSMLNRIMGVEDMEICQITPVKSLKEISPEPKSSDFDTSTVRSPVFSRRTHGKHGLQVDGMSPAAAERAFNLRYDIKDANFAKGAYGKVEIGFDKVTQQKVAVKRIPKSTPIKMIQGEVKAGQLIGEHPNIATFHKYFDFGDHHALVFQFIEGSDLFSYLEGTGFTPNPEDDVRRILTDIVKAVQHCHTKTIAHRDIKLENILVNNGKAFLIDFGLCGIIEDGKLSRDWCGSDNYLCPQIVRRIPYDGMQADVFSMGVVAFALLFGVFPFENLFVNSKYSQDPRRPLPRLHVRFPTDVKVSRDAKDLLLGMLEDDADVRITCDEILRHPWITQIAESPLTAMSNE